MLRELTTEHVKDPKNTNKMLNLAREYDKIGNGAAAISFYTRAADIEEIDKLLQYKCMIYAGQCFARQNNRDYTVFGFYQNAVALTLDRPEGYFLLSCELAKRNEWNSCLIYARLGLKHAKVETIVDINYPGEYALRYMQALAMWKIAGSDIARLEFFDLKYKTVLNDEYKEKVDRMLLETNYTASIPYKKEDINSYRYKFNSLENIETNYSKCLQDMFVLSCHNGKRNGTYLEIGSGHQTVNSNTFLLEKEFDWRGISIDNNKELSFNFGQSRHNTIMQMDALEIDYSELLQKHCFPEIIDYLQIGVNSCKLLKKIPFDSVDFGVITFKHDSYKNSESREESRKILTEAGYMLVGRNISVNFIDGYEDWYVHPEIVENYVQLLTDEKINFVWQYLMNINN
jgi:hypothetical protein